jgi:hypothetical protein
MNEKELLDIIYRIKDIIKDDDGPNTMLRKIEQLVDWALAQE